jgi:hypothetical protein
MRIEPPRASGPGVQETRKSPAVAAKRVPENEARLRAANAAPAILQPGQELEAVVVEELADGRLVLDIGGGLLEANDPGSLAVGQRLRLQVDLTEPQVLLHIVEQDLPLRGEIARLLRQRLPVEGQEPLAALENLLASAEALEPNSPPPAWLEKLKLFLTRLINAKEAMTPERLHELVRDGGLHYEMKLSRGAAIKDAQLMEIAEGDLKGLLLGALEELTAAGAGEPSRAVAGQLYHLEGQQAANLLAQIDGRAFQFHVPLFTGAGFTDVAVSIERDSGGRGERDKKGAGEYAVLFALELEEFGCLRIDARVRGNFLTAVFYAEKEYSLKQLRLELPRLEESLQALGFSRVALGARALREIRRDQELRFTALALGMPADAGLLNVKV